MPHILRDISLVMVGVGATLVVQSGLPTIGLLIYGSDFKAAYMDCVTARAMAMRLKPGEVSAKTYAAFRNTVLVDEFRCLDSQTLYERLKQFRVSGPTINGIETEAKQQDPEVNQ